ncbi:MAG TPA: hypothetical protein VN851_00405 [Thermoanaerobaculia bacterium]|nr:hypothetical protein [Thermoanaerobaculia bacterium]
MKTRPLSFLAAVVGPTTESFDQFPTGFLPQTTLVMGALTVQLTNSGSSPIQAPGPFGFTTNFLSTGVQDGDNNVVITFPAGTKAAGMKLVSVFPVTVAATFASGTVVENFSASEVSFLGFAEGGGLNGGLQTIRISSPVTPSGTPIVNVGDITYASGLTGFLVDVPALSPTGIAALALGLLIAGWRISVAQRRLA